MPEILQVVRPLVVQHLRLRRRYKRSDIGRFGHRNHKGRLELRMNLVIRRISVGVRPGPAVELKRVMQRLRSIGHIMSQPRCVKQNRRLSGLRILICRNQLAILPQPRFQPFVDLLHLPWLKPNLLRRQVQLRMRDRGLLHRTDKVVPQPRQLLPARRTSILARRTPHISVIHPLHVNKVIRRLRHRQLVLRAVLPPVRFRPQILHRVQRRTVPQKRRDIHRQIRRRESINHFVPIRAPRKALLHKQHRQQRHRGRKTYHPEKFRHAKSITIRY